MQSLTYMLSFITFASLLSWLSNFSLQEGRDQTASIIAEVKGRWKCDDESLLKTYTSEPNYIQPDNQRKPFRDLSEAAAVIWQGFHDSLELQDSLNS